MIITYLIKMFLSSIVPRPASVPIQIRMVAGFDTSTRRSTQLILGVKRFISSAIKTNQKIQTVTSRSEFDSHADTCVAGANCCILSYTGKECDVAPYSDDYKPIPNIPIVTAATAWQSRSTGQVYIIVPEEALWMGDSMQTTLINPNQSRHFGVVIQNDPISNIPMHLRTKDASFSLPIYMQRTIAGFTSHTPSEDELEHCPHIHITSSKPWNPSTVTFQKTDRTLESVLRQVKD